MRDKIFGKILQYGDGKDQILNVFRATTGRFIRSKMIVLFHKLVKHVFESVNLSVCFWTPSGMDCLSSPGYISEVFYFVFYAHLSLWCNFFKSIYQLKTIPSKYMKERTIIFLLMHCN